MCVCVCVWGGVKTHKMIFFMLNIIFNKKKLNYAEDTVFRLFVFCLAIIFLVFFSFFILRLVKIKPYTPHTHTHHHFH